MQGGIADYKGNDEEGKHWPPLLKKKKKKNCSRSVSGDWTILQPSMGP